MIEWGRMGTVPSLRGTVPNGDSSGGTLRPGGAGKVENPCKQQNGILSNPYP